MSNDYLPKKAPELFGARRPGRTVEITLDRTGTSLSATYIGSGRFTTAYRAGSDVILYTFYNDFSKSILAQTYREWGRSNPHLPRISRIGQLTHERRLVNVYQAKHYNRVIVSHLSLENRRVVEILQEAHDEACHLYPENVVPELKGQEFNQVIINAEGLPARMRLALKHLSDVSLDWGDHYIFDNFHKRNWGLDGQERLILIDPMFDMARIQRDHEWRRKSGRTWA